ncbi:MAG: hypothetical protein ABI543_11295 [Ignavibacteria bacterium]
MNSNKPIFFFGFSVFVFFISSFLTDRELILNIFIKSISFIVGLIFFLIILKDKNKSYKFKIIIVFLVVMLGVTYVLLLPFFFRSFIKLYIYRYNDELMEINTILLEKDSSISLRKSDYYDNKNSLDSIQQGKIQELLKKTDLYWVGKHDRQVEYELHGFLDNRYGIIYSLESINDTLRHSEKVSDNWYLYSFPH